MDIVIISEFLGDIDHLNEINDRFLYVAKLLKDSNNVEIITSNFIHSRKKQAKNPPNIYNGCKITAIYEPGYFRNVSFKRLYSHFLLGKNIKKYIKTRKIPDVIYLAVPSLSVANEVAYYCRKHSVRLILDIQDLWPEAFEMVFHIPLISSLLFAPLKICANKIYRQADDIIAVSETYLKRAMDKNKKCKNGQSVYLGTDLALFDLYRSKKHLSEEDNIIRLVYVGTLGHSYDLFCVFDAMEILYKSGMNKLEIFIMGDGPLREKYERYAKNKNIKANFTGRLPYATMVKRLTECDIAINPISKGAAQSIINKHADYVAAGLPILSTQENLEFQNLIIQYKMGINCNNADSVDLASGLKHLILNYDERIQMGINARRCAEELFDRGATYYNIVSIINNSDRFK